MSVVQSKRTQGDLEVIVKAKRMVAHTIRLCENTNNFPKRYRLTYTDKMINKAIEIYVTLLEANELYPHSKADFERRQNMQRQAMAYCRTLLGMIDIANELFHLPSDSVAHWSKLVIEIRYMTVAWFNKENERFKNLK